jgi:outer membrane protein assembly factor BamE
MFLRSIIVVALLLAGCTPYRMDIQQGNVVTQEMVAKLQPGMTRSQVRFALGTPLVVDPFREDRWDYVYVLMKRGEVVEKRRLVIVFKDEKLARIEGDKMPPGPGGAKVDKPAVPAAGAPPEKK